MIDVTIFSALLGGLITFLAPCTLPLIPGYIAFIGGTSGNTESVSLQVRRRRQLQNAIYFVLGFSFVFIFFGVVSGVIGKFLILHRATIASIGGILVIYLGLTMFTRLPLPRFSFHGNTPVSLLRPGSPIGAFLLGFLFALGWTPCLGPILGTILILASGTGTALAGGFLLATYALGLAIPFLLIAYFFGSSFSYIPKMEKYLPLLQTVGGIMIVFIGILLVAGQFGILNSWAAHILGQNTFDALVDYM